jgi:hypothetical protein
MLVVAEAIWAAGHLAAWKLQSRELCLVFLQRAHLAAWTRELNSACVLQGALGLLSCLLKEPAAATNVLPFMNLFTAAAMRAFTSAILMWLSISTSSPGAAADFEYPSGDCHSPSTRHHVSHMSRDMELSQRVPGINLSLLAII